MKKNSIFLILVLTLFITNLNAENIHAVPGQIFPGTQVTFSIQGGGPPNPQSTYKWNFGDGTPQIENTQVNHSFKEPGNYTITCEKGIPGGGQPTILSLRLSVSERRTVQPKGMNFTAGSPAQLEAKFFVDNTLNWEFGDGSSSNGPKNRNHTYQNPGNYTVKVKDYGGNSPSVISCTINIAPDNRSINYQPGNPRAGQVVTFQVVNFSSENLRWNFKDGTIINGGASKEHIFSTAGNFKIKVTDLAIGPDSFIEQQVNIAPDNRSISMNPPNPSLYKEVTFNAVNFTGGMIDWNFDHGITKTGGPMEKFTFSHMGPHNIKAREAGSSAPYIKLMVSINQDMRKILIQPPSALVGQQVMIKLQNSNANNVSWKIGNDNPLNNSPKEIQYIFKDPGRVEVKAEIQEQSPVKEFIMINDNRMIRSESNHIFAKMEAKLSAVNFNNQILKWDLGDGTIKNSGNQITHKYMNPGNFTIRVFDFNGMSKIPVKLRINVARDNRVIICQNRTVIAGSEVEFEARNFISNQIRWNLASGIERRGSRIIKHKYKNPGTYRIYAVDFDGKGSRKIEYSLNVIKDSRILEIGKSIIAGVPVSMQIKNSQGGNYEWKFPSGKIASGQNPGEIIFNSPGAKQIYITDRTGFYPPIVKTITVQPDNRSLEVASETILKGEALKILGKYFNGMKVKWDFGDGSPPQVLSNDVKYKYKSTGTFKITAIDYEGKGKKLFTKTVKVKDQTDDFSINAIELSFSNGKYYRVIPMKSFSPGYRLRLKMSGRGIVTGNWLFDGKVLGMFTKLLAGKSLITLKGKDVPKLPVLEPGVHSLSFEFTNYNYEEKVPTLRYFVTNSGVIKTISPITGAKLTTKENIRLKWQKRRKGDRYQISVSAIPFQFLTENKTKWIDTGTDSHFDIETKQFKSGQWIYWQVRMVDASGYILTVSEISFFKIL